MVRVLMIPTVFLLLLGSFCYVLSTRGTDAEDPKARPIVFCNADEIKTLDVSKTSWQNDLRTAMALWEGLVSYNPGTLAMEPGVAERWTVTPDGKLYTFYLRKNARWSNGDPVTAENFHFAWKRVLTPSTGADYISLLKVVDGAEAFTAAMEEYAKAPLGERTGEMPSAIAGVDSSDPYVLKVRLNSPCTYFLELCGFPPLYPLHARAMAAFLDKKDPAQGYDPMWANPPHLVTNGPFTLVEWRFKQFLRLVPNEYYWDRAAVKADSILIKAISGDERAAMLAYQTGTVDILTFFPQTFGDDLLAAKQEGKWAEVHYRPVFGSYYYIFNCTRKPLTDKRVRRALSMALDRKEIVEKVTRMRQKPLGLLVPPESIAGYTSPSELPMDVEAARKLLADAGYPNGEGFPALEYVYNTDAPTHAAIGQAIGQMWQRHLNIKTTFRGLERSSFSAERRKSNFDIARGGWYGDYGDPTTWLDLLRTTDGNNDGKFSSPAYDALLDTAAAEPDAAKRFGMLREAEAMLVNDEMPLLPLYQYADGFVYDDKKIKGVYTNVRLMTPFKGIHRVP